MGIDFMWRIIFILFMPGEIEIEICWSEFLENF